MAEHVTERNRLEFLTDWLNLNLSNGQRNDGLNSIVYNILRIRQIIPFQVGTGLAL